MYKISKYHTPTTFLISLIISLVLMVQGNRVLANDFTFIQNQLSYDIFKLKLGLDRLKVSIEVLNKRHMHQLMDLNKMVLSCTEEGNVPIQFNTFTNEDTCNALLIHSNETLTKYQQFNVRLFEKLQEMNEAQMKHLDALLTKPDLKNNCQNMITDLLRTSVDSTLDLINEKVNKFEQQMLQLESLGEKLSAQQTHSEKHIDGQLKILNEIKQKLIQHEGRFAKFQNELPNMNTFSNTLNNLTTWRHWWHRSKPN